MAPADVRLPATLRDSTLKKHIRAIYVSVKSSGDFDVNVFGNIQNVQLGFYLPANTTFTDFRIDVDNVSVAVPEPASLGLLAVAGASIVLRRRRLA